jgi:hypothetical protein
MKAALAVLAEKAIKLKKNRQQKRGDIIYGRNWTPIMTSQAAARNGKRDRSSMVARPILPNPKRLGVGTKGKVKRWTQQEITKYTGGEMNKSSQRQKNKSKGKIIIYDADI